jgi:SAM-dependent methyltransferase
MRMRRSKQLAGLQCGSVTGDPRIDNREAIAIEFPHGLGDLVQLGVVLHHLHAAWPALQIDAICEIGKTRSRTPWERRRLGFHSLSYQRDTYKQVIRLGWEECVSDVDAFPATKPFRSLVEVFRVRPEQERFGYAMLVGQTARDRAAAYLAEISGVTDPPGGRFPVALVHAFGTSSPMQKNLPREIVAELCAHLKTLGLAVALLHVEGPPTLAVELQVQCPIRGHPVWAHPGQADPETMLALIDASALMVGIDSGPLHIAGCSSTPTLGVWTHHHPIRYFDFAANVVHLVPRGHEGLALGPRSVDTFRHRYRHVVYPRLLPTLCDTASLLCEVKMKAKKQEGITVQGLTATNYGEQFYREHVQGGLDYLGHGDWQISYGAWLATVFRWRGQRVLDVGCACGSILRGLGQAGIVVEGIDVSSFMLALGREKWPDMAPLLHEADAADLSLYADGTWDGIHCAQVAEHWRPDQVPAIAAELARVTADGGLWFCCLDTTELFKRQGRPADGGDPTHICVRPMSWWHKQVSKHGWQIVSDEYAPRLWAGCDSFLRRYDWDWFVARRLPRKG